MRLDSYLVKNKFFDSRTKAKQAIERGEIFVDSKLIKKSSFEVLGEPLIERICQSDFVSIGGFKLEKALKEFNYDVNNLVVADIGASTGGFTDCLIKNGAKKVYAVDLRDDLLHPKLKNEPKVNLIVKNAKDLVKDDFDCPLDLIVADLSFISVSQVLSVFEKLISNGKDVIILIKPQFETGQKKRFKNGIIRDDKIHKNVCLNVYKSAINNNLMPLKITSAPNSAEKNKEFLMLLKKGGQIKLAENFINYL